MTNPQEPQLLTSGQFALYQTPKGAMHLTLIVEGETDPRHVEIPQMMVKFMMRKAGKGNGFGPAELTPNPDDFRFDPTAFIEEGGLS
jgi:hypothetical protein